jgi:hypothetical protein
MLASERNALMHEIDAAATESDMRGSGSDDSSPR